MNLLRIVCSMEQAFHGLALDALGGRAGNWAFGW